MTSVRRVRKLAAARSHDERDSILQRWSDDVVRALRVEVLADGIDRIGDGPYVVIALHEGLLDVPILIATLPIPMTFVARNSLDTELPVPGLLAASEQILIDPEAQGSLGKMLRASALLTTQGRSIATFPQGSVLGIEIAFRAGPFVTAQKLDLEVLPVVLSGSHRAWEHPYSPLVRLDTTVCLRVLEPRRLSTEAEYRELERHMKAEALAAIAQPRHFDPGRDGYWDGFAFEIDPDFAEVAELVSRHRSR